MIDESLGCLEFSHTFVLYFVLVSPRGLIIRSFLTWGLGPLRRMNGLREAMMNVLEAEPMPRSQRQKCYLGSPAALLYDPNVPAENKIFIKQW
jgi:hypothetical protein